MLLGAKSFLTTPVGIQLDILLKLRKIYGGKYFFNEFLMFWKKFIEIVYLFKIIIIFLSQNNIYNEILII